MTDRSVIVRNPVPRSLRVYVAPSCPNCQRFYESLRKIPALHPVTAVIDVQRNPQRGVSAVPTVVVDDSRKLTGSDAFRYLLGFESVLADPPGECSLGFSCLGGGADDHNSSWYGAY